jgi:hypothetical protein
MNGEKQRVRCELQPTRNDRRRGSDSELGELPVTTYGGIVEQAGAKYTATCINQANSDTFPAASKPSRRAQLSSRLEFSSRRRAGRDCIVPGSDVARRNQEKLNTKEAETGKREDRSEETKQRRCVRLGAVRTGPELSSESCVIAAIRFFGITQVLSSPLRSVRAGRKEIEGQSV